MNLEPHETAYRTPEPDRPAWVEQPCPVCHDTIEDHDREQLAACRQRGLKTP